MTQNMYEYLNSLNKYKNDPEFDQECIKEQIKLVETQPDVIEQESKDKKIIGNINLHKKNSLYNNINITHETEINHHNMSISYKVFLNSIHIGNIKKDSNYNNKISLIFNPSNNVLGACTGNTIEEINKKIKERINDILKFISIFD